MDKESFGAGGGGVERKKGRQTIQRSGKQSEKEQYSELAYGANVENT